MKGGLTSAMPHDTVMEEGAWFFNDEGEAMVLFNNNWVHEMHIDWLLACQI